MDICPICENSLIEAQTTDRDSDWVSCPNCGSYELTRTARVNLARWRDAHPERVILPKDARTED